MPIKQSISEINWLKVGVGALIQLGTVAGMLCALAASFGDNRYAAKSAEDDIARIASDMRLNDAMDVAHHNSSDLHMAQTVKDITYVRRPEWLEGKSEMRLLINTSAAGMKEDIGEVKAIIETQRKEQKEYQNQQTQFNTELIVLLKSKP